MASFAHVLLAALALLALTGSVVPDHHPYYVVQVSTAKLDPYWLWGNLTWAAGAKDGAVSWDANPPSPSPGGPPLPAPVAAGVSAEGQEQFAASYLRRFTGKDDLAALPPPDVFKSAPVPRLLHVNASSPIQLDLIVTAPDQAASTDKTAECDSLEAWDDGQCSIEKLLCPYALDVELYAGTTLLSGGVAGEKASPALDPRLQAVPSGYAACYYRMPSEMSTIDAGTELTLKVLHISQEGPFQYGLAGDVRSELRIPFYSAEEWAFRNPAGGDQAAGGMDMSGMTLASQSDAAGAVGAGPLFLVAAGLGAVALVVLAGARGRSVLAVLLLASVGFSGCLGSHAAGKAPAANGLGPGRLTSTLSEDQGGLSSAANGTILGFVHDDVGAPLSGVHVSVLGTGAFADSDHRGRFLLREVPPGRHTVRFELAGYRPVEGAIDPKAGFLLHVSVMLVPLVHRSSDARPHIHDNWGFLDKLVAVDQDVPVTCTALAPDTTSQTDSPDVYACSPTVRFDPPETPPHPDHEVGTIVPGTYEVEVSLHWDPAQLQVPRFGLLVESNNPTDNRCHSGCGRNWTEFYPRGPDASFHIQSNWDMDDVGHQRLSSWSFRAFLAPADYAGAEAGWSNAVDAQTDAFPAVHVKAVLHKGILPLEPPHPDIWAGQDAFTVMAPPTGDPYPIGYIAMCQTGSLTPMPMTQVPTKLVPFGSRWLDVQFALSGDTVPHMDWALSYHPANMDARRYGDDWTKFKPAPKPPTVNGNRYTWVIPLADEEPDGAYAKFSNWAFAIVPTDPTSYCAQNESQDWQNTVRTLPTSGFTVVAHAGAPP